MKTEMDGIDGTGWIGWRLQINWYLKIMLQKTGKHESKDLCDVVNRDKKIEKFKHFYVLLGKTPPSVSSLTRNWVNKSCKFWFLHLKHDGPKKGGYSWNAYIFHVVSSGGRKKSILECLFEKLLIQFCLWKQDSKV